MPLLAFTAKGKPGAIIETTAGRIRGVQLDRVHAFKGIPLGLQLKARGAFSRRCRPRRATGVRDAFALGPRSPQGRATYVAEWQPLTGTEPPGEECLHLHVWTPSASTGVARSVMGLTKPLDADSLMTTVRVALDHSRIAQQHESEVADLRTCYESLTRREREVMALVVKGLLNKQVAGELGISEITVKANRGQVMRKMKADSLAQLVRIAARLTARSPKP